MAGPPEEQRDLLDSGTHHPPARSGRRWLVLPVAVALVIAGVVYADQRGAPRPSDDRGVSVGDQLAVPTPRGLLADADEAARGEGTDAGSGEWTAATAPTAADWTARGSLRNLPAVRRLADQVSRAHPYHRAQLLYAENVGDGQLVLTLLRLEDASSPSRVIALWRPADASDQEFQEISQVPFTGDQRSVSWAQTADGVFADVVALGPPGQGHAHVAVHRLTASGQLDRADHRMDAPDGVVVTRVPARSTRMLRVRVFTGSLRLSDGPPTLTSADSEIDAVEVPARAVASLPRRLRGLGRTAVRTVASAIGVHPSELVTVTSWGRTRLPAGRRVDTVALTLLRRDGGAVQTVWQDERRGNRRSGGFVVPHVLARRVPAATAHQLPIAWLGRDVLVVAPERGADVVRLKVPGQPVVEAPVHGRLARVDWPYDRGLRGLRVQAGRDEPALVIAGNADAEDPLDVGRG
jgi:hypothetical protein